jgi:hypothetical protein
VAPLVRIKPGSIIQVFDEGFGGPCSEMYSSTCKHCQHVTYFPTMRNMMEYVEICRHCMHLICLECYEQLRFQSCETYEDKALRSEMEHDLSSKLIVAGWRCY